MKHLYISFLILLSQVYGTWGGWWFSSNNEETHDPLKTQMISSAVGAEFSIQTLDNDEKGMNLVESAKLVMLTSKSCSLNAYQDLSAGCSKIVAEEELKYKLAWDLSDCFQQHTGRPAFPLCDSRKNPMKKCLQKLSDDSHKVFLEFFLQINTICHQLQIHAFKHQTERLVNELKRSAEYAEEKLEDIEEQGKELLQNSNQIYNSLASIDIQTHQLAETSKNVEDHVNVVKKYTEVVHEQSKGIAASQLELSESQKKMKENLDAGISMLHDSYDNLGIEINNLRDETVEIEKEIGKVGEEMFTKMSTLQNKADDIENMTGNSLDKQKQLLDAQTAALDGLQFLTKFQSQALEENRDTLQQMAEFGKNQQEELLRRQEQLQQAHDHLVANSKTILAAQEAFESKQASMFIAIDKLFALHNALLLESRAIKAFFFYSLIILVLYIFTSMKQTYNVRPRLYIGLCVTFVIELIILRRATYDIEQMGWIITSLRSIFLVLAAIQLLYAINTYRDYEMLNHQMLLTLMDKINGLHGLQSNEESLLDMDEESDVNWSLWVDCELPEDVDKSEDPDFVVAEEGREFSLESSSVTKKYNLRNRRKHL
ncbi:GAMETE EXPRESSED 1 [Olea europaea subsp. europaea]|uniref:GAMETE EXPRESSED 1 n=1 Tax=Olea europaea subsp. europaea TaxID=158383 RepID=A0A8S0TFR3_OLEEU|nr:GAMETE EXPRESSED 1 [Olea europaea subsp. europaea]